MEKESTDAVEKKVDVRVDQVLADSHENILHKNKLLIVFAAMAIALFISFVDQTGITIALPYIAKDLHAEDTISWAGTASLISTTVFMVLFGRFSDIFSRKYVLVVCMLILGIFDLACGFAKTPYQLFVFRGFCGIGNGGITSLTMVIVSDVVSLKDRGKFQGILGACVGLGNACGPFIASAFLSRVSWRYYYYTLFPIVMVATFMVIWLIPYTRPEYNLKQKLLQIDYLGFFFSAVGIIFVLIPLSAGGSVYAWNSPLVISMFVIGAVSLGCFLYVELKVATLPIISLSLFTFRPSLTFLLSQNFFFGMCYYSALYYYPYYFEIIRGNNVIHTSLYLLCLVIPQSVTSVITGQLISRTGRYIYVVWFGYICWTLAMCLLNLWSTKSSKAVQIITLILNGMGVGATFQPTLVAAQAQSFKKDRAIVISARNVLRSFGGAIGLAVCSTIISNGAIKELKKNGLKYFTQEQLSILQGKAFSQIDTNLAPDQIQFLKETYMKSLKSVFYLWIVSMAFCLITTITIRDRGLQSLDTLEEKE